jgi:CDP-glucose 4,6-dehydratase
VKLAVGRAGNVIGGGDWAKDRIVVDCMISWSNGEKVEIRSPEATRPWQHVLEPLSGYLKLGADLFDDEKLHGEAFNFGPRAEQNHTVIELLDDLSKYWNFNNLSDAYTVTDNIPFHEAGLLKLICDKALFHLKWQASLDYSQTIEFVSRWYFDFYKSDQDMHKLTVDQIKNYQEIAADKGLTWTA